MACRRGSSARPAATGSTSAHALIEPRRARQASGRQASDMTARAKRAAWCAVRSHGGEPARLAFFALYALQHRGQESAGICTADGASLQQPDRHGPGQPGLPRARPRQARRLPGDRPHALLDDRLEPRRERPADRRQLGPGQPGAGPQRQPGQRRRAARGGRAPRRHAAHVDRLRADRAPDRPGARRRLARAACATRCRRLQRRVLPGDADARPRVRRARPVGHSPAGARPTRATAGWSPPRAAPWTRSAPS